LEFKDIIGNYDVKEYLVKSIKNKNILIPFLDEPLLTSNSSFAGFV